MFRQKLYNSKDNSLFNRLKYLESNNVIFDKIKFWDIDLKCWIDYDNLIDYKIQKEILSNDELIFYIYLENCNEE